MKSVTRWPIDEINRLHGEVVKAAKTTLEKAIRIGELLDNIKSTLPYGSWLPWVRENLRFTDRTARNYMRLYEHRAQLKNGNVSDLAEAYATLTAAKPVDRHRLDALETTID